MSVFRHHLKFASSNVTLFCAFMQFVCLMYCILKMFVYVTGCENQVCNPRMGNLAVGRPVQTISQCGSASPERYCSATYKMDRCAMHCEVCDASVTHLAHPPASMTDSPFKHPPTWWQSAQGVSTESLQLDLEVEFYFTHIIIIFRSARPAAMAIERSQDFGHTWSALMLYAHNCSDVFNLEDGQSCTQKYSTAEPCSNGEVRVCMSVSAISEMQFGVNNDDLLKGVVHPKILICSKRNLRPSKV